MGENLTYNSEYGRRDRQHFLCSLHGGIHRRDDGVPHGQHALDSEDQGCCNEKIFPARKTIFRITRRFSQALKPIAFISHPKVPNRKGMVIIANTTVEDDREVIEIAEVPATLDFAHGVCPWDHGVYRPYRAVCRPCRGVYLLDHGVRRLEHGLCRSTDGVRRSDQSVFRSSHGFCLLDHGLRLVDHGFWHRADGLRTQDHLLKTGDRGRRSRDYLLRRR